MTEVSNDLFAAAQRLQQQGQPYALVSVVRTEPPASARPGDKALATAQGIVHGWIGGGCAQPAVLHTVREALKDGRARLVRIAPVEAEEPRDARSLLRDVAEFGMSCHSGGTLELFVDPILPPSRLVIIGDSPVAVALAGLAPRVGLQVTVIAKGADRARFPDASQVIETDDTGALTAQVAPAALIVVATQGRRDLQGLRAALALNARKVWLVASTRKGQVLRELLLAAQHDPAAVNAIVAPAGAPIGAQTPEEIALSVLAAVVAARRAGHSPGEQAVAAEVVAEAQAEPAGDEPGHSPHQDCCGH
ncbi:MAG TPA: XdhC family protein [Steroidobacteraceae bacterium]|nr:XdhC family protein [Steroidobacteraceae bacterium]